MNTPAMAFLKEMYLRLGAKSPRFFQIWNYINGAAALLSGIPTLLDFFDYHPLGKVGLAISKVVSLAAAWGWFNSKMTAERTTVTSDGSVIVPETKSGKEKVVSLPFTEKVEQQKFLTQESSKIVVDMKDKG